MVVASKVGDWAFKAFTAGLGLATIYMTGTFTVNVYRGLSWHNAQKQFESNIHVVISSFLRSTFRCMDHVGITSTSLRMIKISIMSPLIVNYLQRLWKAENEGSTDQNAEKS